ncbi:MAG: thiamine-phosphate kinase [Candidatus Marisimplicoccus sp.]
MGKEENLSNIGETDLINKITKSFKLSNKSSTLGIGDDAAILNFNQKEIVVSKDMLVEGVHFDLSYMPLKHLGYKSIIVNVSDILSMNASPSQILVSIAASNRFKLNAIEAIYDGINAACSEYNLDLVGGDTTSSNKGLIISVTCIGSIENKKVVKRSGAKDGDIVVVSGDLGGSYMGLQILEREKSVFEVNPNSQPDLSEYTYCIQRQLKPEARNDVVKELNKLNIVPTAMIDISDGLSTEINHISSSSNISIHIYEDKIPISDETKNACNEFKINPTVAALNGGEDYELLFTVSKKNSKKIIDNPLFTILGSCTKKKNDNCMITGIGQKISIGSEGWDPFNKE